MSSIKIEDTPPLTTQAVENISTNGDIILVVGPIRLRVLSAQLINASSTFKAMLNGPFSEGQRTNSEIPLPDDDAAAMRTLMSIIHHQNDAVPNALSLPEILTISKAADKYDCTIVVKFVAKAWYHEIESSAPSLPLETHIALATSTYLLKDHVTFRRYTRALVVEHVWTVKTLLTMFDDEAIMGQILVGLVLAMDEQRAKTFQSLESDIQIFPSRLRERHPSFAADSLDRVRDTILAFVHGQTQGQLFSGVGSTTVEQAVIAISESKARAVLKNHASIIIPRITADLGVVVTRAKQVACGICLKCLCEGHEFPENCAEHAAKSAQ